MCLAYTLASLRKKQRILSIFLINIPTTKKKKKIVYYLVDDGKQKNTRFRQHQNSSICVFIVAKFSLICFI